MKYYPVSFQKVSPIRIVTFKGRKVLLRATRKDVLIDISLNHHKAYSENQVHSANRMILEENQ